MTTAVSACQDCRAVTSGHCPRHPWGGSVTDVLDRSEKIGRDVLDLLTGDNPERKEK